MEECDNLRKLGVLAGRYELIEGMIIDKMGSGGKHPLLIRVLMVALTRLFGEGNTLRKKRLKATKMKQAFIG